ncbi:MAG: HEAT repeat domain-containing protein, partial [Planctomycetota bacterium]
DFAKGAEELFLGDRLHVARALVDRARDEGRDDAERVLAVELLGATVSKAAVQPLIDLWAARGPPVDAAARKALDEIFSLGLSSAADAREWWNANSHKPMVKILQELGRREANGDVAKRGAVERLRKLLKGASLDDLVKVYLTDEIPEIREMGAERLGTYPYDEREGEGAADARRQAGGAILDLLTKESDPAAAVAGLGAVRVLLSSVKDEELDRALGLVEARLDSNHREVKLAAVAAVGDFERRPDQAEQLLRKKYDSLVGRDAECRLAVLDSIDRIGKATMGWIRDKLEGFEEEDERITVRLIQLLKKNGNNAASRASIPTLIKLLSLSEKAQIRQEAASALGLLGVRSGNAEAIAALAENGLEDDDTSVRVISAKQLGGAPEVDEEVIERLRARLRETEPQASVRVAAAQSLLKLRGAGALEYLSDYLADDGLWDAAVMSYINADLVAGAQADPAARFVKSLCDLGHHERTVVAARLLLVVKEIKWEESADARGEVAMCLARSLDQTDHPTEALEAMKDVPEKLPSSDPRGVDRALLLARILRRAGQPEKVEAALDKVLKLEDPPPDAIAQANLELARALLLLGRFDDALQKVKPLISDPVYGEQAAEIERRALAGRGNGKPTPEEALKDLDSTDPAVRGKAIAELKALGKEVHGRLAQWLAARKPEEIAEAVKTIAAITGITVPYDPESPEAARMKLIEELRKPPPR